MRASRGAYYITLAAAPLRFDASRLLERIAPVAD
jgi:hypothetical protein